MFKHIIIAMTKEAHEVMLRNIPGAISIITDTDTTEYAIEVTNVLTPKEMENLIGNAEYAFDDILSVPVN